MKLQENKTLYDEINGRLKNTEKEIIKIEEEKKKVETEIQILFDVNQQI